MGQATEKVSTIDVIINNYNTRKVSTICHSNIKEEEILTVKKLHRSDDGGRNWSDVSTSQRVPSITSKHKKLEEAKKNSTL